MKLAALIPLVCLLLLAVTALPSHSQSAVPDKPTLYLLSVGVSQYADSVNSLSFPAKDAAAVAALFRAQQGRLFGRVVSVTLTDRGATREAVIRSLVALRRQGRRMKPTDYVLVFLAGHGTVNDLGQYVFAPYDVDASDLDSTGIPGPEFSQSLAGLPGHALWMLETGQAAPNRSDVQAPLALIASCGPEEASRSVGVGDGGAFAQALLEGLNGRADADKNGEVTLGELENYLETRVSALTKGVQHPLLVKPASVSADLPLAVVK